MSSARSTAGASVSKRWSKGVFGPAFITVSSVS
jgi:hypothetical protein